MCQFMCLSQTSIKISYVIWSPLQCSARQEVIDCFVDIDGIVSQSTKAIVIYDILSVVALFLLHFIDPGKLCRKVMLPMLKSSTNYALHEKCLSNLSDKQDNPKSTIDYSHLYQGKCYAIQWPFDDCQIFLFRVFSMFSACDLRCMISKFKMTSEETNVIRELQF